MEQSPSATQRAVDHDADHVIYKPQCQNTLTSRTAPGLMSQATCPCRGADAAIANSIRSDMERKRQMSLPVAMMLRAPSSLHPTLPTFQASLSIYSASMHLNPKGCTAASLLGGHHHRFSLRVDLGLGMQHRMHNAALAVHRHLCLFKLQTYVTCTLC